MGPIVFKKSSHWQESVGRAMKKTSIFAKVKKIRKGGNRMTNMYRKFWLSRGMVKWKYFEADKKRWTRKNAWNSVQDGVQIDEQLRILKSKLVESRIMWPWWSLFQFGSETSRSSSSVLILKKGKKRKKYWNSRGKKESIKETKKELLRLSF